MSARRNYDPDDVQFIIPPESLVPQEEGDWVEEQLKKLMREGKHWDVGELQAEYERLKKAGKL